MPKAVEQPKQENKPKKFRYACHGCTKNAGFFDAPGLNLIVICPHCGKEQLTKLENFVAL